MLVIPTFVSLISLYYVVSHSFVFLLIGKRTAENVISDADQIIQNFQDQFNKLKLAFTQHAVCETQLVVLRIFNTVQKLGKLYYILEILQLTMSFRYSCRSQGHVLC